MPVITVNWWEATLYNPSRDGQPVDDPGGKPL
jgi:hypothetical protein